MFRAGRTHIVWRQVREWCHKNPQKIAAIATPEGIYEIKFVPNGVEKRGVDLTLTEPSDSHSWVKDRFTKP